MTPLNPVANQNSKHVDPQPQAVSGVAESAEKSSGREGDGNGAKAGSRKNVAVAGRARKCERIR